MRCRVVAKKGGGCGFAVRAADHERRFVTQEKVGQRLGHGEIGQGQTPKLYGFRVYGPHHIADNHQIRLRVQVLGQKALLHRNVQAGQKIRHGRIDILIRARDVEAPGLEHPGQGGHGRAADADQVNMTDMFRSYVAARIQLRLHLPTVRSMAA